MARRINPEFGPCDSILFLALWWSGGGICKLPRIIGLYDFVNRSIPTAEDLDGALNRLLAAGLIVKRRGGFCIPMTTLRAFNRFRKRRRRDRFVMAEQFVNAAGPLESVPRRVTIRRADHDRAYAEHRRSFAEACNEVFGGRA